MYLSRYDYLMGLDCIKALWLKKNHKKMISNYNETTLEIFDNSSQVYNLAYNFYPNGVIIESNLDIENGLIQTKNMGEKYNVLFGAFAKYQNCFCQADILIRNNDVWDIIEIKSSNSIKNYCIDDLAFQKYVFEGASYQIGQCKVLHLNSNYIRQGVLDIKQLFIEDEVTERVLQKKSEVEIHIQDMLLYQTITDEPKIALHSSCSNCKFYGYCGKNLPTYSIFNLLNSKKADAFYNSTHLYEIKIYQFLTVIQINN